MNLLPWIDSRDKRDTKGNYIEFCNNEIYDKLKSNKSTIRSILSKLVKQNNLTKIQDGCYKFNNSFKTAPMETNGKNDDNQNLKTWLNRQKSNNSSKTVNNSKTNNFNNLCPLKPKTSPN